MTKKKKKKRFVNFSSWWLQAAVLKTAELLLLLYWKCILVRSQRCLKMIHSSPLQFPLRVLCIHSYCLTSSLSTFIQSLLKPNCPQQFHTFVYESIIEWVLGNFRLHHKTHFIPPLMSEKMEHSAVYHRRAGRCPIRGRQLWQFN